MGIELKVTDDEQGVVLAYSGFIADDEYRETLLSHFAEAPDQFQRYRYSISDFLAVTEIGITAETIGRIAQESLAAAQRNPDVIVALVADKDLYFGLSRMWASMVEPIPWETRVFRTREEADDWVRARVNARFGIDNPSLC